jgi:5-methylthioadenosine/S-adenosylhomocysteine deaminase
MNIDLLIEHGVVVTLDAGRRILYDGSVAVAGGRIVAVGPSAALADRYAPARTLDGRGKAILPGFVDTHHHFLQNGLKGSRDDLPFPTWIERVSAPRIVAAVADYAAGDGALQTIATRLGCAEALLSGITTILNMEWATQPEVIGVYEEAGIRAVHALTMTDYDQWGRPGMLMAPAAAWELAERLIARCAGSAGGRVQFRYGLACANSCTTELLQAARRRATEAGVGLHIHVAESAFEGENMRARYGASTVGYLARIGFLGPDVLAAHAIYVSDDDIRLLAESGTAVSYCAECHMKLALGIAPVTKMLAAGVTVALGTDTCAVNDNMDMFEAARVGALLQKVAAGDPAVLPAQTALEVATLNGARALGLGDDLGSLEAGKKADLILVDLRGYHLRPINNLINNLVYCAHAGDVETVIVDGRVVVEGRRLLTLDAEAVYAEAEAYAARRFG